MLSTQKFIYRSYILHLDTEQLCAIIERNGSGDLCNALRRKKIDGEEFLNLTSQTLSLWRTELNPEQCTRLLAFVEWANSSPSQFYDEGSEETYQNQNQHVNDYDDDFDDFDDFDDDDGHNLGYDQNYDPNVGYDQNSGYNQNFGYDQNSQEDIYGNTEIIGQNSGYDQNIGYDQNSQEDIYGNTEIIQQYNTNPNVQNTSQSSQDQNPGYPSIPKPNVPKKLTPDRFAMIPNATTINPSHTSNTSRFPKPENPSIPPIPKFVHQGHNLKNSEPAQDIPKFRRTSQNRPEIPPFPQRSTSPTTDFPTSVQHPFKRSNPNLTPITPKPFPKPENPSIPQPEIPPFPKLVHPGHPLKNSQISSKSNYDYLMPKPTEPVQDIPKFRRLSPNPPELPPFPQSSPLSKDPPEIPSFPRRSPSPTPDFPNLTPPPPNRIRKTSTDKANPFLNRKLPEIPLAKPIENSVQDLSLNTTDEEYINFLAKQSNPFNDEKVNILANRKLPGVPGRPVLPSLPVEKRNEFRKAPQRETEDKKSKIINRPLPSIPDRDKETKDNDYESFKKSTTDNKDKDYKSQVWYKDIDRVQATHLLKNKPNGSFIIRPSSQFYCTVTITYNNKIYNFGVKQDSSGLFTIGSFTKVLFNSVYDLVDHYMENEFYLNYGGKNIALKLNNFL